MTLADTLATIYAGITATAELSFTDYDSATDSLQYVFRSTTYNFTATADAATGGDWTLTLSSGLTASAPGDEYVFIGRVTDSDGVTYMVDQGVVTIVADPAAMTRDQETLAAIRALIDGRATNDQRTTQIGEVQLQHMRPEDLIKWYNYFEARVNKELDRMKQVAGRSKRNIFAKFNRV